MKYVILFIVVAVCVFGSIVVLFPKPFLDLVSTEYVATSQRAVSFYLEDDYDTVRKVFVRTGASTELIELTSGKVISQKMDKPGLELKKIRPFQWNVHTDVIVQLIPYDKDLQDRILVLCSNVRIDPTHMIMHTYMLKSVKHLRQYNTDLTLTQVGNRTKVDINVAIQVVWRVPKSYESEVQRRVDESCNNAVIKLQQGIAQVVETHKGAEFSWTFRK